MPCPPIIDRRGTIMATTIEEHLADLCNKATSYGASKAVPIPVSFVVMDPRVSLKCQIPRCVSYGRNLMCPPNCVRPEEFARSLERYKFAVLVQAKIITDLASVERRLGATSLVEVINDEDYRRQLRASTRSFEIILNKLERDAMMGHRFALALSGGACSLCDECVGISSGEPCRHPFEARPSMEAVGIDVLLTAENSGAPIEFPAKDPVWTGIVLVE
jgi:predicted metal-binding protein